jgi:hypothetical protein
MSQHMNGDILVTDRHFRVDHRRTKGGGEVDDIPKLTSPHPSSPHLTSPHLTSPHLTSPQLT